MLRPRSDDPGAIVIWCGVFSPFPTRPITGSHLARRVRIAPMPSPKALPAPRDGLLDGHLGVTEADGLGFAATTGTDHKLLICTGRPAWAIAG